MSALLLVSVWKEERGKPFDFKSGLRRRLLQSNAGLGISWLCVEPGVADGAVIVVELR